MELIEESPEYEIPPEIQAIGMQTEEEQLMGQPEPQEVIRLSDSEVVGIVTEELARGIGGTTNLETTDISLALDYYLARFPGMSKRKAKDPQASRYVSTDVMDGIEATMSEIMPMFADEQLALFNPSGEQDIEQAELESSLINYLFINEYNGYIVLQDLIKDALLNRNCIAKAYWDERAVVEYEVHDNLPAMGLQQVLQPKAPKQQVEIVEQYVDGQQQIQPQNQQQAAMQMIVGPWVEETFSVKIKRTTLIGKPVIDTIAPENIIVCSDLRSPLTHDARFIAHRKIETASSLIEQGINPEIVNNLPSYTDTLENYSRNVTYNNDYQSADESTDLKEVYECYILLDVDGDGIAERRKILIGGDNTLLLNEEWSGIPLIGGVATMVPHAYEGVSLFDRLKPVQDAKTPIIRAIIDGTLLASNPRIGVVTGQVNMDDIITSVTGGVVRADNSGAVFQLPNPEVPQSSYQMLGFMDEQRREKGGSAIGTANMAQNISGDSAHAVERTMSAMELSNALIAKTIAETVIRGLFIHLHKIIRENYQTEITAKIGGKWVSSYPNTWQTRANVTIQVGSSQGERRRKSAVMDKIVMAQAQLAAQSSVLFSEEKLFDAISDGAKLDGIPNPERYFVDVTSPEGQQIKQQKDQETAQEKQKMDDLQAKMAKAQQDIANAELMKGQAALQSQQAKLQVEATKAQSDQHKLQSDNVIAGLQLELDNAKNDITAAKASAEIQFKYAQLESEQALKLTEMELTAAKDLSEQYEENKEEIEE